MDLLRAYVRLFLIIAATLFLYSLFLPALILPLFGKSELPWRNKMWYWWGSICARLTGMEYLCSGTPPEPPFFLVSNHLSYVDIFLLYSQLKCTFIAKREVKNWPVLGFMMKSMGIIFVDRTRKADVKRVNGQIAQNLNKYQGIVLFPEGTTSGGDTVLPFKSSLLALPAQQETPVRYATISYQTVKGEESASKKVCWWGDMTFFRHLLQMLRMKRYYGHVTFYEQAVTHKDRKKLSSTLEHLVRTHYLSEIEHKTHA